ncbi:hypothetical protein PanWU01x14_247450 [Parasponia andersonii]|uniref:Uncharacterized protein n=1 Tax=Parasponia andersonii TaxID=3476 RepID=A0A2P5BDX7_PARAD|nr:hypothetical protein PanWU01x14_247450 [Parasponia andersonii]
MGNNIWILESQMSGRNIKLMMACHHSVRAQSQADVGKAKNATPDWACFRIMTYLQVHIPLSSNQGYSQAWNACDGAKRIAARGGTT